MSLWQTRSIDLQRHLSDLESATYETAESRVDREGVMRRGFEFATPVALRTLREVNEVTLNGTGRIEVVPPSDDGAGGLIGSWALSWPLQQADVHRLTGNPLDGLSIMVAFAAGPWTHPHVMLPMPGFPERVAAWPFQVTSEEDAERQGPVFVILLECQLHERIYQAVSNWRVVPPRIDPGTR